MQEQQHAAVIFRRQHHIEPTESLLAKLACTVVSAIYPIGDHSQAVKADQAPMRGEIGSKWSKMTAQDILALKSNDDLVCQVQAKYQLRRHQAQSEVDAFAKGRKL